MPRPRKTSSPPHWLAIRFPQLSLDLQSRGQSCTRDPLVNGARAVKLDRPAERQALERLAAWCYQYSSQVCIPGDRSGLFLEAGASKRLFGPPDRLCKRLEQELGQIGYRAMTGSAPTPEAAWLGTHEGLHIGLPGHIRQQLGALPLSRLHLDAALAVRRGDELLHLLQSTEHLVEPLRPPRIVGRVGQ